MSGNDELISQFIEISGSDESVAKFYLSQTNWSLEEALSNFLGSNDESHTSQSNHNAQESVMGDKTTKPSSSGESNFAQSSSKPKFATLRDMANREDDDNDSQAFYAGGSDRSGQQVLGPPKKKNFREQLTEMFRMAQDNSLHEESPSPSSRSNWGQGIRLGMTNTDHSVVGGSNNSGESSDRKPTVILKLWSQGFSIGDGELRLYEDPDNKEFLETVMRGEVPQELLQMGWMVNVDVEDHRHEDFKKPLEKANFKGAGHALGSPVPSVECGQTASAPASSTNAAKEEKAAETNLTLKPDQPTTTIQIRLADGTRLATQFNLSHTVGDIYEYITSSRPQYSNNIFVLVTSFPTRELLDRTITLEEAGLKNAAIMQRLK